MAALSFSLNIPAQEYLRYYRGQARQVVVTAANGQRIAFAAHHLRPFVSLEGVYGDFVLEIDNQNRFKSLRKI